MQMAQAAQLVMAVQTMCGNPSFAPVAPFEAARNDVCPSPARCAASPDQQVCHPSETSLQHALFARVHVNKLHLFYALPWYVIIREPMNSMQDQFCLAPVLAC